jgi:SAM-dependent methyltransferase
MPLECRACAEPLHEVVVDLGSSPLANSYLRAEDLDRPETFLPLCPRVCTRCWLVQLPHIVAPEAIFSDYAYFSSYSTSWLRHAEDFAVAASDRFALRGTSLVLEAASNDGYLLRAFKARGIPVLGIEPAANVAQAAIELGIPTEVRFFGTETARELAGRGQRADLFVANNVLAHTPYLNDFVAGIRAVLKDDGVATLEFPHLARLIAENQFDTIYHEHYSYFSLSAVRRVFAAQDLDIFDVEELPTHGGSLRLYAQPAGPRRPRSPRVDGVLEAEAAAGMETLGTYREFAERVRETKRKLLEFLIDAARRGQRIAGYGAPAKGNTLLNYCGIRTDFLAYTVDRSPHKQGHFLPGTRIPIHPPEKIFATRPDLILILPWNLSAEISDQMREARSWGGRFVVAIPEVRLL